MKLVVNCPHCNQTIFIEKRNCGIFRCGVLKKNGKQNPPHSKREKCEKLLNEELIYGCSRPFMLIGDKVEKCGYI